jgi:hypothetical protein
VTVRAPLAQIVRFFEHTAGCSVSDFHDADEGWQRELRQPDLRDRGCDLAGIAPAPDAAHERIGNLDLVGVVYLDVPEPRTSGERPVLGSQRPQAEAVPVPMGHVGCPVFLGGFRRAHAADVASDIGIQMQRDEIGEVIFIQPFGGQSVGAEVIHAACRSCIPARRPDTASAPRFRIRRR